MPIPCDYPFYIGLPFLIMPYGDPVNKVLVRMYIGKMMVPAKSAILCPGNQGMEYFFLCGKRVLDPFCRFFCNSPGKYPSGIRFYAHRYYLKSIKSWGSTGLPLLHNSKWRWSPVVSSPVFPTEATTSPARTTSP